MIKNIVIDFSYLGTFCGFGNIAKHYSQMLAVNHVPNIHFIFIVPERFVGLFGSHIDYFRKEYLKLDAHAFQLPIHLWHATTQNYSYRRFSKETIQLLTVHDMNFLYEKRYIHKWKHLWKLKKHIKQSDAITTISNYVKEDLVRHTAFNEKNIEVIYNGIQNLLDFSEQCPAFIHDSHEKFFFTIGQVLEKKGFASLIPMMKYFPEYKLYICGDTQFKYAEKLRKIINLHGNGRCFLTGKITEKEKKWMYKNCQAFMLPSHSEGFGLPVIEAMQMQCPVFLLAKTCLPEIGNRFAYYWELDDSPEYMANVVHQGLATIDSQRLAEEQAYALSFSYERYTNAYITLYQKLLNI